MLKRLKVILVFSLLYLFTATGCDVLYKSGLRQDGVYIIHPDDLGRFKVRCDMKTDRGGWTVIQKRQDGSKDFYRGWFDYKKGFGDLNGESWLGLDKVHRLSKSGQNTLRVDLMNFNGAERYAKYESFGVADGSDEYRLNISGYHCAALYKGGWWYKACYHSNLNDLYFGADRISVTGIVWFGWQGYDVLKKTEVKMRPSQ